MNPSDLVGEMTMATRRGASDQLIGTGGVYYVMAQLAFREFHASCTFGNAPFVDILVGAVDGAKTVSLQVKTAREARRWAGSGKDLQVKELQWTLGYKLATHSRPGLFYAFVDLKGFKAGEVPDVYIIPSEWIKTYCKPWVDTAKWLRFHVPPDQVKSFKNCWEKLSEALS
jgi:hypothetical protein